MARPSRQGPSRRGGSYSSQRGSNQPRQGAQRGTGGRRPNGARGGYGSGGRSGGGNEQMPLYIGLGVGAALLVVVLLFLLSRGGDDTTPVVNNPEPDRPATTQPATMDGEAPDVLVPFSDAEKDMISEKIEGLDDEYDRAKDLIDQGFVAQNRQDYEDAQAAWKEAQQILNRMDNESNTLETKFGADVWERIESFLPTQNRTLARWAKLRGKFTKYLK